MGPTQVSWFEWGDETFHKARTEDKPIVLSIGARWCHWCHVMDDTTYGDPEIVATLNQDYIPVRVDSDRRPDINDRYNMGGWPTTAFLTPEGRLMGGTTYVPPEQMKQLLAQLQNSYRQSKEKIAAEIKRRDERIAEVKAGLYQNPVTVGDAIFQKTVRGIALTFDAIYGGFGKEPKFPMVPSLRVILQAYQETGGPDFRQILVKTLEAMGNRGMYDAVEGGFFRYSTNESWMVPHFEKMCEDNAALIALYLDASMALEEPRFRDKAEHALGWVRRTLCDPEQAVFFGSQDADEAYYALAANRRSSRPPPAVDRTVYVNWTAAMASTFLRASAILDDAQYGELALRNLDFLARECFDSKAGVCHYYDGRPRLPGLARDTIWLAKVLIDAYEFSGCERYLHSAEEILCLGHERFWREEEGGWIDRAVHPTDVAEMAQPRRNIQENALAAECFIRLYHHVGTESFRERAAKILGAWPDFQDSYGHYTAEYAIAVDWLIHPPFIVERTLHAFKSVAPRKVIRHGDAG